MERIDINLLGKIMNNPWEQDYVEQLYDDLVCKSYWKIISDMEKQKLLYETFIDYYNIIISGKIKEAEEHKHISSDRAELILINECKIQLDKEIDRVKNKIYTKYKEA